MEQIQYNKCAVNYRQSFYAQKDIDKNTVACINADCLKYGIRSRAGLYNLLHADHSELALIWLQALKHLQAVGAFREAIEQLDFVQLMVTLDSFYWDEADSPTELTVFKSMVRPTVLDKCKHIVPQLVEHMMRNRYAPAAHQAPQLHIANEEFQAVGQGTRSFISALLIDGCFANDMVIAAVFLKLCHENELDSYTFAQPDGSIGIAVREKGIGYIVEPYRMHSWQTVKLAELPSPLDRLQLASRIQNAARNFDSPITAHPTKSSRLLGLEVLCALLMGRNIPRAAIIRLKHKIPYLDQLSRAVKDSCYNLEDCLISDYNFSRSIAGAQSNCGLRWYRGIRASRFR